MGLLYVLGRCRCGTFGLGMLPVNALDRESGFGMWKGADLDIEACGEGFVASCGYEDGADRGRVA